MKKYNVYNSMLTLFIEGFGIFVIIVGSKLGTNDNSYTIYNLYMVVLDINL